MLTADDLRRAASLAEASLAPVAGGDWSVAAGDLEWSCRRTIGHVSDALLFYAAHLATRSRERRAFLHEDATEASPRSALDTLVGAAWILAAVAEATPAHVRAYHPAGLADVEGFIAMGCDEIIVHTADVAAGLGSSFEPPRDLCARVRDRLFPWAPTDVDPWAGLAWANGRRELAEHDRLGPDWRWHCAPLDEWDGPSPEAAAPER